MRTSLPLPPSDQHSLMKGVKGQNSVQTRLWGEIYKIRANGHDLWPTTCTFFALLVIFGDFVVVRGDLRSLLRPRCSMLSARAAFLGVLSTTNAMDCLRLACNTHRSIRKVLYEGHTSHTHTQRKRQTRMGRQSYRRRCNVLRAGRAKVPPFRSAREAADYPLCLKRKKEWKFFF